MGKEQEVKSRALPAFAAPAVKTADSKAAASSSTASGPVITFHPNKDAVSQEEHKRGVRITASRSGKSQMSIKSVLKTVAVLAIIAAAITLLDAFLSSPIKAGQILPPGMIRHKCGVAGLVPGLQAALSAISPSLECENYHLAVEEEKVTGYDKDNNVVWVMLGTDRGSKKVCDVNSQEECKRGLHYTEDGHLVVSGTRITWVETFGGNKLDIYPWPFESKPVARVWRK